MNIFAIDPNPCIAAKHLCDQHVVKMILESSQILSSAAIRWGVKESDMPLTKAGTPARGGYHHHPSTKWAGNNRSNYYWVWMHMYRLCIEYTERFGKSHFCQTQAETLYDLAGAIPCGDLEEFSVAISPDAKCRVLDKEFDSLCPVDQYRSYYRHDKTFGRWKKNKPDWLTSPYVTL